MAGYILPDVLWRFALWRLALTGIGLVINAAVVTLVFPVTARDVLQGLVASALGGIATVAEETVKCALPDAGCDDSSGAGPAASRGGGRGRGGRAVAAAPAGPAAPAALQPTAAASGAPPSPPPLEALSPFVQPE